MTNTDRHAAICGELKALYERKNHDYGDSFHRSFQEYGLLIPIIRQEDKLNRLKALYSNGRRLVGNESLRDTLLDMANYAIMTIMELEESGDAGEA